MISAKKKLLIVITKGDTFGGAQRYVYELAKHLDKEQFHIEVAAGKIAKLGLKLHELQVPIHEVKTLGRDAAALKDFLSIIELWKLFKKIRPDIVHLNSSKAGFVGVIAARLAKIPRIVFTCHGWSHNERHRSIISRSIFYFFHKITVQLASKTIVVSEGALETAPRAKPSKYIRIYNGLFPFTLFPKTHARHELSKKVGGIIPEDMPWIGMLTELHKNKGVDIALLAKKELEKAGIKNALVIIGPGQEKDRLEALAKDLALHHVYFLGFIEEARNYLEAFDVYLMPSRTEALPYALLEAGFAKLPVVASAVGGIPEIITEETGITIQKERPKDLAHAVGYLLSHPDARISLGNALRAHTEYLFTPETFLKKTIEVFLAKD